VAESATAHAKGWTLALSCPDSFEREGGDCVLRNVRVTLAHSPSVSVAGVVPVSVSVILYYRMKGQQGIFDQKVCDFTEGSQVRVDESFEKRLKAEAAGPLKMWATAEIRLTQIGDLPFGIAKGVDPIAKIQATLTTQKHPVSVSLPDGPEAGSRRRPATSAGDYAIRDITFSGNRVRVKGVAQPSCLIGLTVRPDSPRSRDLDVQYVDGVFEATFVLPDGMRGPVAVALWRRSVSRDRCHDGPDGGACEYCRRNGHHLVDRVAHQIKSDR
jgi:hypothetical protein